MADAHLLNFRDPRHRDDVRIVKAVAGVDAQPQGAGVARGAADDGEQFPPARGVPFIRVFPRVDLDHFRARPAAGVDLRFHRIDEQADRDAALVQPLHRRADCSGPARDVEAPLGGEFAPALGHEGRQLRPDPPGDPDDFRRRGHLEVEFGLHAAAQAPHILVDDVPAVLPQVADDAGSPRLLGGERRGHRVGFFTAPGVAHRGDVVDVDGEPHSRFLMMNWNRLGERSMTRSPSGTRREGMA